MNLILLILGFETPPLEAYGTRRFKRYEWSNSRLGVTICWKMVKISNTPQFQRLIPRNSGPTYFYDKSHMFILFYSARASKRTQSRLLELDGSKDIKNTFHFSQYFAPGEISTSNLVALGISVLHFLQKNGTNFSVLSNY